MLETINRIFVVSTKQSADKYGCGHDLGWANSLGLGNKPELIITCEHIKHFDVIKDESVLNRIQSTITRWNECHHFDEIHTFLYQAISIENFISDEKSRKYVTKSIENRFSSFLSLYNLFSNRLPKKESHSNEKNFIQTNFAIY